MRRSIDHIKMLHINSAFRAGFVGVCLAVSPPVQAQEAIPGRIERERLATLELAVFNESAKRLQDIEKKDPIRALAEYRKFLVGRAPSPVVAVQAAIKVATVRENLKDIGGALQTCDLFANKYSGDPASVQLLFQKAEILIRQNRFAEATQCIDNMLPTMLDQRPELYDRVSKFMLQLAQTNIDSGGEAGRRLASVLCVGVEQIYFNWIRKNTPDHLWQRFEALKEVYIRSFTKGWRSSASDPASARSCRRRGHDLGDGPLGDGSW
jgi:hypothetical protein